MVGRSCPKGGGICTPPAAVIKEFAASRRREESANSLIKRVGRGLGGASGRTRPGDGARAAGRGVAGGMGGRDGPRSVAAILELWQLAKVPKSGMSWRHNSKIDAGGAAGGAARAARRGDQGSNL